MALSTGRASGRLRPTRIRAEVRLSVGRRCTLNPGAVRATPVPSARARRAAAGPLVHAVAQRRRQVERSIQRLLGSRRYAAGDEQSELVLREEPDVGARLDVGVLDELAGIVGDPMLANRVRGERLTPALGDARLRARKKERRGCGRRPPQRPSCMEPNSDGVRCRRSVRGVAASRARWTRQRVRGMSSDGERYARIRPPAVAVSRPEEGRRGPAEAGESASRPIPPTAAKRQDSSHAARHDLL
jgi:hypothetical protein